MTVVSDFDTDREYCNETGCWQQNSWTAFNFIKKDNIEKWEMRQDGTSAEITFRDGTTFANRNDGQSVEFVGINGEVWENSNFGQAVIYKNINGDKWTNENFGQGITFESASGETWESVNFGSVLEFRDANGNITWKGSTNDTVDDMR